MKLKTLVLFLSLLISSSVLQSQQKSIDLSPLENSKIVLLGEQTHYDGATFDAKVDIIKKLHQEFGFNIIVFESGLYDNYKAYQLYQSNKEDISIYNQSVFPIWTETTAFKTLLDYISKHSEMKILGFDNQESFLFKDYFIPDLKTLLDENGLSLSDEIYTIIEKTLIYRDIDIYVNNKTDSLALYKTFKAIDYQLSKVKTKTLDSEIIKQTFKGVVSDFDTSLKLAQKEKVYIQNPRDKQMAENLIFLQQQFPDEKIIGWGASYHFANAIDSFEYSTTTENYITEFYNLSNSKSAHNHTSLEESINQIKALQYSIPMGKLLKEYYGDDLYSMGFTAYSGTYFGEHNIEFPILVPPKNSLETELFDTIADAKLIDRVDFPKTKFYTSTLGYLPIYANWDTVFDGIYYIPEMYLPKYRDYNETSETTLIKKDILVDGVVKEKESNTSIPYVDVYYSSNNKSTITNSKGEFSIIKSKNQNDYLIFSSIGYQTDSIQIRSIKSTLDIRLRQIENVVSLNEVVLRNSKTLSAKEILKKAEKKVKENYVQTPFNQKFYFKVQYITKDSLRLNEEALIETYFKKGNNGTNNPDNNIFGQVINIRNTTNNFSKNKERGIGGLWHTIIRDVVLSKTNVLYRSSSYELKKEGLLEYNGKKVYKISFINTSPGSYSTGYGYPSPISSNGVIYIDKDTLAVLYYEHCVARQEYDYKRFNNKRRSFHKIIQTYKEVNGKYFMNLFKVIDKTNYYSKVDNTLLDSSYSIRSLMSTDIEIEKVKSIARPIRNLKQNIFLDKSSDFWKINKFYIEDNSYKFDGCD